MAREYNLRERADIVALAQECAQSLAAQPLIDYFTNLLVPDESAEIREMIFDEFSEYRDLDLKAAYEKHETVKGIIDELVEQLISELSEGGFCNENINYWIEYNEGTIDALEEEIHKCEGE